MISFTKAESIRECSGGFRISFDSWGEGTILSHPPYRPLPKKGNPTVMLVLAPFCLPSFRNTKCLESDRWSTCRADSFHSATLSSESAALPTQTLTLSQHESHDPSLPRQERWKALDVRRGAGGNSHPPIRPPLNRVTRCIYA